MKLVFKDTDNVLKGVSASGYYAWKNRLESNRSQENQELVEKIYQIHQENWQVYGSPRIYQELQDRGVPCSENRVARLMKINEIRSKTKRKYKVTTDSNHTYPVSPKSLAERL